VLVTMIGTVYPRHSRYGEIETYPFPSIRAPSGSLKSDKRCSIATFIVVAALAADMREIPANVFVNNIAF